ncbi:uncharacterized protein SPAPADRAFT_61037 [Spathaspora passalidarum NRRL Y-27907]|uniref:Uncharacterized protein n=1 Tax=Spathaspora passalidarum (strain NRRL Y-27907 / 11-Y1) TaxID=619300 RepID=G3ANE5_SPAPN|nr:uncharacterized protein SPAPADRAFT_61037 [Spathaspora passalidarum NRRL Y-27907]EGW31934.1 hypothetical protein SPAPADRAFT_61037 [Spathaspora passalidarum NRRL Y-27907]
MLCGIILISLAYFLDPDSTEVSTLNTEPAADPLVQDVDSHKLTNVVVNIGLVLHEFWKNYLIYATLEFYWYSVIVFNVAYYLFSCGTISAAMLDAQMPGGELVSRRTCKITGTMLLISNWVRFTLRSYLDHQ